jgi:hypothetical protein
MGEHTRKRARRSVLNCTARVMDGKSAPERLGMPSMVRWRLGGIIIDAASNDQVWNGIQARFQRCS